MRTIIVEWRAVVYDSNGETIASFPLERYDLTPHEAQVFWHAQRNDGWQVASEYAAAQAKLRKFEPRDAFYHFAPVEFATERVVVQ